MSLKLGSIALALGLIGSPLALAADAATEIDLRRAAPADVYMAVFAKRNAERDYQREYFQDVWETAREERIGERILKLVTSRVPKEKLEKAESAWEQVREALEPINGEALLNAEQFLFAQRMKGPFNQQLLAVRLSEDQAANAEQAIKQVFELAAEWGEDKVTVEESDLGEATVTTLRLPEESPFQPGVARLGDVVVFCTAPELLRSSVELLAGDSGESKFDDPRFKAAMEHLPEPEDAVVFFDGRQLWESMGQIGDFIREKAPDEEKALRIASLMDRIIEEVSILDYEISVQYTEDGQNRTVALGKLVEDAEDKILGRAVTQGEPFEDWQEWIPENATGFSMSTGVNLHEIYEGVMKIVREEFPESHEGLEKFAEVQDEVDVDVDEDILQSFSGECVSVRLTIEDENGNDSPQGATALKCENPERIRELINRAVEGLNQLPALEAQGLELVDSDELEGFQEIQANIFKGAGARPVIGFKDGWMIVSSHVEAAKQLVAVRSGEADSIADGDLLDDFDVDADETVYAVSYSDVGAGIRAAADAIDKVGMAAPMFVGMMAAQADEEDMEAIQEAIGLLPSIAKVVRKLDFFEDRLTITQQGPLPDSYLKRTVIQIRQPDAEHEAQQ